MTQIYQTLTQKQGFHETGSLKTPLVKSVAATLPQKRPQSLCAVCGRVQGRLPTDLGMGRSPVRLCLRCHHGLMRQRRIIRAQTKSGGFSVRRIAKHAGELIVSRRSGLSVTSRDRRLSQSRRRAQSVVRRMIERVEPRQKFIRGEPDG